MAHLDCWARRLEDAAAKRRLRFWKNWQHQALCSEGGRSVVNILKGHQPIPILVVPEDSGGPLRAATFDEVVEARAVPWCSLWKIDEPYVETFPLDGPMADLTDLVFPSSFHLQGVLKSYRWSTSVGVDHWPPRLLGFLDDWHLDVLRGIIRSMVCMARSPRHFLHLLAHLIPKSDGGDRPIGVFPTLLRITSRWFRRAYGSVWQGRQPAFAHWGIRDRSIEHGVWRMSAFLEWCRASGRSAACFFLDIAKAFENIEHEVLVRLARKTSFSELLLKWTIHLCRFPHSVVFLGSLARTVVATKTVVPGDSFADLMMRIMISPAAHYLRREHPSCFPAVVVDDVQCLVHRPDPVAVGRVAARLLDGAVAVMENELHLPVSRPKLTSIFSWSTSKKAACSVSPLVATSSCAAVRNLGVDFSVTGTKSRKVRKKRMDTLKVRAVRLKRIVRSARSAKAKRFQKNGLGAVAVFGGGITGMSATDLRALRSAYRSCLKGKANCRSLAWDLHRAQCDPAVEAIRMVVKLFSTGWHMPLLPCNILRVVFRKYVDGTSSLRDGPVAAFVNTLRLIGWALHDDCHINIGGADPVHIDQLYPWEISALADKAVQKAMWVQAAGHREHYHHLVATPFVEGVAVAMKACPVRHGHLVDGLCAGIYAGARTCKCGVHFDHDQKLWWHIWWECPILTEIRRTMVDSSILRAASRSLSPWMATALFPHPMTDFPPAAQEMAVVWCAGSAKGPAIGSPCFGREAFSDGSTLRPNCKWSSRSGWAVIQVSSGGSLLTSAFGCFTGLVQDNNAAEIWARNLDPALHEAVLYSDSLMAVTGFADLSFACRVGLPYASIWNSIRLAIADMEGVILSVVWVPAHISVAAALCRGASGLHRRAGNRWADALAKAGAGLHPDRPECRTRASRIQEVLNVIVPFFGAGLACLVDSSLLPDRPPASRLGRLPRLRSHLVVEGGVGGFARCCRCLRIASNAGNILGPCLPRDTVPHHLCSMPGGLFCSVCGAYSFSRTHLLSKGCRGHPRLKSAAARRLARLWAGLHPVNGRSLGGFPKDLWQGALEVDL